MNLKAESDEAWIVKPIAGYVCKWKDVKIDGPLLGEESKKCFVNVCHCSQIPPPLEDLNEEELAAKLDAADTSYRIPICVGELDCVKDRKEDNAIKIDVLVNSAFYASRLQSADSTFFRHFLALVFCDMIKSKHCIDIDPMKSIILKNRSVVGELESFKLRKTPEKRVVEEQKFLESKEEQVKNIAEEVKEIYGIKRIEGVKLKLFDGKRLEMNLCCEKIEPKPINSTRMKLKMTPTRCLLILDKSKSLYDFSTPFTFNLNTVKSKFVKEKCLLVISVDIVFPRE